MLEIEILTRIVFFFLVLVLFISLVIYRCAFLMEPLDRKQRLLARIQQLRKEIRTFKNLKIETEKKYYQGKIDDKSFENIMREYEEEIVRRENRLRILTKFYRKER
ncbi:MAG: hypothetical protein OH354_01590 [Candidatus Parvarchaeota archaeon]|nr:hypothetical protein [Candidatus Jingweiarchaeum tengchongense]MCW1300093.1 hypothetical protein [Candidatus Jingweiarchaeum tengchongense]MCW1304447.1 hypothetical protein [Candidatus Jingweiarchaeum tengchongense]MCW1305614.1 hypothetical protein [Candidatus Jingweiarchaeum tengchongense]MCW1309265.1 hypothetical protein [Candidatus Jingweiarchaeum tengchongense]